MSALAAEVCSNCPPMMPELAARRARVEQVSEEIGLLTGYLNAANARLLQLIAEFDELEGWGDEGAHSCAHWLNWKCGFSMNAARERVRTARALQVLPRMQSQFAEGRISYSKVRAMTRVATPENEDYLVDVALNHTAAQVERLVRGYRWCLSQEVQNEKARAQQRFCNYWWDSDGCLVVSARLSPEQGAAFVNALECAEHNGELPPQEAYEHDTEAVLGVCAVAPEPAAQRCADALGVVAEAFPANKEVTRSGAERYHVSLVADAAVLSEEHTPAETSSGFAGPQRCDIEHGPAVSAETLRRLSCDASVTPVTVNEQGEPLSIGRRSRTIPTAIRKALQLRDGHCRFPGCHHTRWVDGHHIKHWAHGGETSLDNLVLLCRYHHKLVHESGFTVQRTGANEFEFRSPRGNIVTQPAPWYGRYIPELGVTIESDTAMCQWDGLASDYSASVEHLQELDGKLRKPENGE